MAFAALVVVSCAAISGRSLWIDEACTATKVVPTTLAGWWQALSGDRSADAQMPLYMLYVWAWARVFGSGELSLHAANVPWFVAGALALILTFPPGDRRRNTAICVVLLCPFAWYYLDEARPYTMQLGASFLIVASLARLACFLPPSSTASEAETAPGREGQGGARGSKGLPVSGGLGDSSESQAITVALFLLGLVVLSGSSLTGMVWAGAALASMPVLLSFRRVFVLVKDYWYLWLATGGVLTLFAGYYLWTLTLGARASASATTSVGSVIFIGYELLGFTGLGPGRLEMRVAGPAALRPHLPWLALYGAAVAALIGAALLHMVKTRSRLSLMVLLCCTLPAAFVLGVGCVAHFRVLGRHFTPLLPAVLLLFISGLAVLGQRRSLWARGLAVLFCVLSMASCLSVRFLPRHEKDNYRAAADRAQAALRSGQPVWWNAAEEGARYYGVPLVEHPDNGSAALLVLNPTFETLQSLPAPQVVIASKPDVYDGQSALAGYLRNQHFVPTHKFTAFVIWERSGR